MRIHHHKPAARGVSQLMYVGDDGMAAENSTGMSTPIKLALAAVAIWMLLGAR